MACPWGGHPIGTIILLVIYLLAIIVAALVEQHKFGETSVATKLLVTGGAIGVLLFTVRTCNVSI
jgi:hypothetical protein